MALPDVILEEIFLRLPPDEPESLVRASLASKLWLGRLTSPAFHGHYRDFHGAPPMLGFLFTSSNIDLDPKLVSTTTKFRARVPDSGWEGRKYIARDCRHGRVLLTDMHRRPTERAVWDPMTGRLSVLAAISSSAGAAAVLCGVAGCDHRACHDGPFRVVLIDVDRGVASACVSSPETAGEWSKPCPALDLGEPIITVFSSMPSVLVRDGLFFMFTYFADDTIHILKYDLASHCLSVLEAPLGAGLVDASMLMAMQDSSLGMLTMAYNSTLCLWSMKMGVDGAASWIVLGLIDLKRFLPAQIHGTLLFPVGSVEGSDVVFVSTDVGFTTDHGIYQINLNSRSWKKIWERQGFVALLPYMSFYSPRARTSHSNVAQ